MKTKLVQIGNSRGVRLPKSFIERAGLRDDVEMDVRDNHIILRRPAPADRSGWEEAFRKAIAKHGPDKADAEWLSVPNDFDAKEWTW